MNSNRFGRGLLFALLAVRLGWAQAAPTDMPNPLSEHAALRLDVPILALSATKSVRPAVGDPGGEGGVPGVPQFGAGPDGTGSLPDARGGDVDGGGSFPTSPVTPSPTSTVSPQLPGADAPALLAAGPDGAGGLPRKHVKKIADPEGGG